MTELEGMERKWREWCEAHARTDAPRTVPLDRVPQLLLALVRDEREACALVALVLNAGAREIGQLEHADAIAAAIRARCQP